MRKFCFLLCLTSVLLTSCKQKPQKQNPIPVVAEQKIDSVQQNDTIAMPIVKKNIVKQNDTIITPIDKRDSLSRDTIIYYNGSWDHFRCDTVVSNYRIRHAIVDNNNLLPATNYDNKYLRFYRDTNVEIKVEYNAKEILHKILTKKDFEDFFSWTYEFPKFQIMYISVAGVENEVLSVEVNLCVPDTDNIDFFYLKISPDGGFSIENFIPEGAYADEDEEMREKMERDSLERANSIQMEQAVHNDTLKVDSIVIGD